MAITFYSFKEQLAHKDEWRMVGPKNDFAVVVSRHWKATLHPAIRETVEYVNQWCVYAYIYPAHRLFNEASKAEGWLPAVMDLPFHGDITLKRLHFDEKKQISSVQLGADYNRCGDERFQRYVTKYEAHEVFRDAYNLFVELMK